MIAWLVDTLIATSALMLLVLIVREPVRRAFGASVAYALWLVPAVRSVLPTFTETVERTVSAEPVPLLLSSGSPVAAAADGQPPFDWVLLILALWLAGAATMLCRGLATYLRQRRTILRDAVQLARLDGIRIIRSEHVRGPAAFGLLDRIVVVPFDFEHRFTERQRCLALEHELAHHRRGDLAANHFAFVLLCLQWFNPLAWAAHAAFRFDQEAACDSRVLDKVEPAERVTYGAAIARAASGRMLLFAGALDRPTTLSRRLKIMTQLPSPRARSLGYLLVGIAALVALPMTASTAIEYVDVAAPQAPQAPVPPVAPEAPPAPTLLAAQVTPPAPPIGPRLPSSTGQAVDMVNERGVTVDGVTKKWEDLTPEERAEIRADIAKARADVQRELARLPAELARMQEEMAKFRNGEFQREMERARQDMRRAIEEMDRDGQHLKARGVDAEQLKADLRRSLAEVEKIDVERIVRDAMAAVDMAKIRADMAAANKSFDDIDARLDRLDRQ